MLFLGLLVLGGAAGGGVAYFIYQKYSAGLPDVKELKDYEPSLTTVIYSDTNERIGEFYIERRILVPIDEIPLKMIQATIAVEDSHFYDHWGIDLQGILRAAIKNFLAGHVVEGGSTITQQLAKTMFLSRERNIERKIREAILAVHIEKHFSKNEILDIYLNQIYYGHGAYGVEAASQIYFGKHIGELSVSEIALIAALPRAPSNYSPYLHPARAKDRRDHVLRRLQANGFITSEEAEAAMAQPFQLGDRESIQGNEAPYFMEYVRRYIEEAYGATRLYRSGFHVYTTLNLDFQREAQKALFWGLRENDKRYGFRGPLFWPGTLEDNAKNGSLGYTVGQMVPFPWEPEGNGRESSIIPGRILIGSVSDVQSDRAEVSLGIMAGELQLKNMSWARKPDKEVDGKWVRIQQVSDALKTGDIIEVRVLPPDKEKEKGSDHARVQLALEQEPVVQGALLCLEPSTGQIKAMIGGYDHNKSQFNRAIQARRQPGSAFKPVIYTTALESGYTPATIVLDSPVVFKDTEEQNLKWKPENFEEKFYGPTRIRSAVTHSRNLVTIKVLKDIGIRPIMEMARRLGVESPLAADLSLALGSSGVTLMELISVYNTFAAGGSRLKPYAIRYIKNRDGHIIEENHQEPEQALSPEIAYSMTSILKSVVEEGTGKIVSTLGRPVAGKTGTTNNYVDAWFLGFTTDLVTGVWVGLDENESLGKGETGSRAAAPIWLNFMQEVERGKPIHDFPIPSAIVFKKIDKETGLLAPFGQPSLVECFLPNKAPVQYAPSGKRDEELLHYGSPSGL